MRPCLRLDVVICAIVLSVLVAVLSACAIAGLGFIGLGGIGAMGRHGGVTEAVTARVQRAHRAAVSMGIAEVVGFLQDAFGQKLVAYLADKQDNKVVGKWASGKQTPQPAAEERLRAEPGLRAASWVVMQDQRPPHREKQQAEHDRDAYVLGEPTTAPQHAKRRCCIGKRRDSNPLAG